MLLTPRLRAPQAIHLLFVCLMIGLTGCQREDRASPAAILSGVPWFDQNAQPVSARGACIVREGDRFYLFGEYKRDGGNAFSGFSCYSSTDLVNWHFERIVLPVQPDGRLGPDRVGERPKVMKCPTTGEYVMYMHTDDAGYRDPAVGYATSPTINGEYIFQGVLPFGDGYVRKWDMGTFQDNDGVGYLITHSGNLFRLSPDYKRVEAQIVKDMTPACESPAIVKHAGIYYWLGSDLTGWERNDNSYFTARSLEGPWEPQGVFAPKGTLTWNSQTTFVLPVTGSAGTTYVYMGDRWAHPYQRSAATAVWQPLVFADGRLSLPTWQPAWHLDIAAGTWAPVDLPGKTLAIQDVPGASWSAGWARHRDEQGHADLRSATRGDVLEVDFTGTQIGLYGVARPDGGFGRVRVTDSQGKIVCETVIETYCFYPEASLKFLSLELPHGRYTLQLEVLGERFFWQGKKASHGSQGDYVSVQKVYLRD